MSQRGRTHPPGPMLGRLLALACLLAAGCVSVTTLPTTLLTPSPDASSGATALPSLSFPVFSVPSLEASPTPARTRRPCEPGDTRPRCQTPTPEPTPTPTPTPTEAPTPTPTLAPTPTPIPMPTGSQGGGVDTDISATPLEINFGNVNSGTSGPVAVTLTNTGGDPFGPINLFGGAPFTAEFNASQNCQGTTLPAGGSCMLSYTFTPSGAGYFVDFSSFTISETSSQSDGEDITIALAGCGPTC